MGYFYNLTYLRVCQISLFCKFNMWLKPYFAQVVCTTLAHMYMCPVFMEIRIIEQEIPNNLCCYI